MARISLLSASVPRETKLTRNVEFIPAEDPAIWAEHMLNMLERHEIRRDERSEEHTSELQSR